MLVPGGDHRQDFVVLGSRSLPASPPASLRGHSLLHQVTEILLHSELLVPEGPGQPPRRHLAVPCCPPVTLHQCGALQAGHSKRGSEKHDLHPSIFLCTPSPVRSP